MAARPAGEIDLTARGLFLLAVKDATSVGGRRSYDPAPDHVVSPGTALVVRGDPAKPRSASATAVTT